MPELFLEIYQTVILFIGMLQIFKFYFWFIMTLHFMFNLIASWLCDVEIEMRCSHYWSNNIFNWSNDRAFNYKVCAFYYPLTFKSICQFLLYLSLNCHNSIYVVIIYNMFVLICCILHFVLSTDNYNLP